MSKLKQIANDKDFRMAVFVIAIMFTYQILLTQVYFGMALEEEHKEQLSVISASVFEVNGRLDLSGVAVKYCIFKGSGNVTIMADLLDSNTFTENITCRAMPLSKDVAMNITRNMFNGKLVLEIGKPYVISKCYFSDMNLPILMEELP